MPSRLYLTRKVLFFTRVAYRVMTYAREEGEGMNERVGTPVPHSLLAVNREAITVKGVLDVISFDESMVLLVTNCGNLALEGSELHITTLDTQNALVEVTGRLSGVLYDDRDAESGRGNDKKGRSRLGRLFG